MNTDLKQNLIALLEEQFIRSDDKVVFDYVMQKKNQVSGIPPATQFQHQH
ncbi:Uncharacterised protein [Salmonella sp. NCTC 11881]|nr:Uncharacterised protein [Salmonella sp. NCTC 11881]